MHAPCRGSSPFESDCGGRGQSEFQLTVRVTLKTALQLVSGSSVTVVDTVPLLMKKSSGFFGRLGNPVTRALPSLLVPTSTCVLRLLQHPSLILRLTLASKIGLPALSFTMKSARHEPRP